MADYLEELMNIPVGPLGIIAMPGCEEMGEKINAYLMKWYEQQAALEEAYPEISISTTVVILGKEYDSSTTVLDLSSMTSGDVDEVGARLALLPNVSEVQLMGSSSVPSFLIITSTEGSLIIMFVLLYIYVFYFFIDFSFNLWYDKRKSPRRTVSFLLI